MATTNSFLIALFGVLVVSCSHPYSLDQKELNEFINDQSNGLSKQQQAGNVQMMVTYRPTDFLVYQEVGDNGTETEIAEARRMYSDYLYFLVSLSSGEKDALYGLSQDQESFSENLQVLSFRMMEHVNMTTNKQDTIPVGDYVYNRTFGLSKSNEMLFVFNKEKVPEEGWVSLNISEFGLRTGRRNFRFDVRDLRSVPKLEELIKIESNKE